MEEEIYNVMNGESNEPVARISVPIIPGKDPVLDDHDFHELEQWLYEKTTDGGDTVTELKRIKWRRTIEVPNVVVEDASAYTAFLEEASKGWREDAIRGGCINLGLINIKTYDRPFFQQDAILVAVEGEADQLMRVWQCHITFTREGVDWTITVPSPVPVVENQRGGDTEELWAKNLAVVFAESFSVISNHYWVLKSIEVNPPVEDTTVVEGDQS